MTHHPTVQHFHDSGDEELLSELRFLVTRILGPCDTCDTLNQASEGQTSGSPVKSGIEFRHGTRESDLATSSRPAAFKLSDLQTMLHARPDARMERWVQNLKNGLGPGDHVFTAELLLSVLQNDCFDRFPPTSGP